jgi:predicted nucleotidyltransferase
MFAGTNGRCRQMNLGKEQRQQIVRIAASHGARRVRLFGSQVRGESTASSDVDILVKSAVPL